MITNRLVRLIRRNRTEHEVPAPLAALHTVRWATVSEQQEAGTLAEARHTVLTGGRLRVRPTHLAPPRPSYRFHLPTCRSGYLTGAIGTFILAGMIALIAQWPSLWYVIAAVASLMIVLRMRVRGLRPSLSRGVRSEDVKNSAQAHTGGGGARVDFWLGHVERALQSWPATLRLALLLTVMLGGAVTIALAMGVIGPLVLAAGGLAMLRSRSRRHAGGVSRISIDRRSDESSRTLS